MYALWRCTYKTFLIKTLTQICNAFLDQQPGNSTKELSVEL